MRVAVVGSGVAGIAAAWTLANAGAEVVVYEKDRHIGGHAYTHHIESKDLDVDLGFMVFNSVTYPNMLEFFDSLGVPLEPSDMSFSVSVPQCEWGSNGIAGLLAHKRNALRPSFWRMIHEMMAFQTDVLQYLKIMEDPTTDERTKAAQAQTLGEFLEWNGYSQMFKDCYLVPVCASIWSCGSEGVLGFDAFSILSFLRNHHMLQLLGRPQWLTVKGRSRAYVEKAVEWVEKRGGSFRTSTEVTSVSNTPDGKVLVEDETGGATVFDRCVMAGHAPDILPVLGKSTTSAEAAILSSFEYSKSDIFLHSDPSFMPRRKAAWSAWNFRGNVRGRVCVTYWLNTLQNLGNTGEPILVTLNPERTPAKIHARWQTSHPVPSVAAAAASVNLPTIQGKRNIVFCGAWQGYGFHEDGFKAGVAAGRCLLGQVVPLRPNHVQMQLTWWTYLARLAVLFFMQGFVHLGSLQLLEEGGTVHDFGQDSSGTNSFIPEIPFLTAWLIKKRATHRHSHTKKLKNQETGKQQASLTNGHASTSAGRQPPVGLKPMNGSASRPVEAKHAANGVERNGETETPVVSVTNGVHGSGGSCDASSSDADVMDKSSIVFAGLAIPDKAVEPEPHLTIHNPAFYWKVATRADLGLADAFIEGDFSCSQGPKGLLTFLELLIINRDSVKHPGRKPLKTKGWWSPALVTAVIGSAEMYLRHLLRYNTPSNARKNISNHYDLSNEMFSKFLDSTMTYSCGIFVNPVEPMEAAQMRKLHRLIAKAQIRKEHRVLEIGFGWGSLTLEMIKRTGCHVTGITLSQQQMQLALERVRAAGLEDHVDFRLCDYRLLPGVGAFDRIVSCEMLEAVGHEYLGDFFYHCDRLLKMEGLLVVQVITTPEDRYDEYRLSSDFIKEYIFPGCCVPSLSALTAAMSSSSCFSVEHLENIGPHYATTLLRWLENFEQKQHEIMAMGFGPKFIRMWQYYFVYCAVGFKTRTLGDLQIVFSRPGNTKTLGDQLVGARLPPLPC